MSSFDDASLAPRGGDFNVASELAKLSDKERYSIIEQARCLRVQREHERRFDSWHDGLRVYLRAERGRSSKLARHLGVRRQSLWRWVNQRNAKFPAWAAVATIVWYFKHNPSADKLLVSPQADKLLIVSPQADKVCPGIPGQTS